jgi:1,4-dihydroxy-6-naphthoate synthase
MQMKLTLGFSPCPNDTFIFDAIANKKIDTGNFEFDIVMDDVQALNEWAIKGRLDITKLSYGVLPLVLDKYLLLSSGSALGRGVGPLLISKVGATDISINETPVAIPGINTTAHLLFSMAYPGAKNKVFLRYDEIENFVLEEKGLGVIIHENRFTYQQKGLHKLADLGEYWEQQTGCPIPLGGIAIKNSIPSETCREIDGLIKKSIEYSFGQYPGLSGFIKDNAKEMSGEVMRKHIDLYVNDYSLELGEEGAEAVARLLEVASMTLPSFSLPSKIFAA